MTKITLDTPEFISWFNACQEKISKYYQDCNYTLGNSKLIAQQGKKYIKINQESSGVWAFINADNGDVLKAASWKSPAKHARGNIFDEANGLKFIGPHGPAYLR